MKLKKTDLTKFSSPFKEWQTEFFSVMQEMVSFSGSEEDLLILLFNDVLPFVKHQYTLYDSLSPAMNCMIELLDRQPDHAESVVSFLAYVFQEPIREANYVLVDPVQYRYLQPALMKQAPLEASLFASARQLYETRRHLVRNVSLRDYFDVTLLNRIEDAPPSFADDHARLSRLVAGSVMRFKRGASFVEERGINIASMYGDLCAALQGRAFDEQALYQTLLDDCLVDHVPWAGGRIGVIAGLTWFLATEARIDARIWTLERLVHTCAALKQRRQTAEVDSLTTDQFLLEDISVLLFRSHLAAERAVSTDELDDVQRSFLKLLSDVYRGHTYALLYAGVAPDGRGANVEPGVSIYDL